MKFCAAAEIHLQNLNDDLEIKDSTRHYWRQCLAALVKSWPALNETEVRRITRPSCSAPCVREAIWGGPGFNENNSFYKQFQKIATVRAANPSLRYGRFYFRPISGDGLNFGISTFNPGVLAFSRILNDEETVIVANTNGAQGESLDVIVDTQLNEVATKYQVLYSNKANFTPPTPVKETGAVTVNEVGGAIGNGPARIIRVTLQPYEVQILRR